MSQHVVGRRFTHFSCRVSPPLLPVCPHLSQPDVAVISDDIRVRPTHTMMWKLILLAFITRHSLVRAKGEVFVLLLLFCSFFCQRFLDNPRANSRQILHAGVLWFRMCLLPFWGLVAPGRRKKGEMKFLSLWESMGNFCILAVFQRYLSNACMDPHQILFM